MVFGPITAIRPGRCPRRSDRPVSLIATANMQTHIGGSAAQAPSGRLIPPNRQRAGSAQRGVAQRGSGEPVYYSAPPYLETTPTLPSPSHLTRLPEGSVLVLPLTGSDSEAATLAPRVLALRDWSRGLPVVLQVVGDAGRHVALSRLIASLPVRGVVLGEEPLEPQLRSQLTGVWNLEHDVLDWLTLRGLRLTPTLRFVVQQLLARAPLHRQSGMLLREVGIPESTARFRLRKKRLMSPSAWLQLGRALHTCLRLQRRPEQPILAVAQELGYADHSALSNQIHRCFRARPGDVRGRLGWEWLMNRWYTNGGPVSRRGA